RVGGANQPVPNRVSEPQKGRSIVVDECPTIVRDPHRAVGVYRVGALVRGTREGSRPTMEAGVVRVRRNTVPAPATSLVWPDTRTPCPITIPERVDQAGAARRGGQLEADIDVPKRRWTRAIAQQDQLARVPQRRLLWTPLLVCRRR